MSETSFVFHSEGSIAAKDLSPNDSRDVLHYEKDVQENGSGTIYKLKKNIGIKFFKEQANRKENFKINFLPLKNEETNSLTNECKISSSIEDEKNTSDAMTKTSSLKNESHIAVKDDTNAPSKLNDSLETTYSAETDHGTNINSYSTGKADETAMKAAFAKVVERFGLSTTDGVTDSSQVFYGVYIPSDTNLRSSDEETIHVYTEKTEALKVMKQSKKARLKQFRTRNEAVNFVIHGSDTVFHSNSLHCASSVEKVMPFKCPKVQDMISFKKAIENCDIEEVKKKIFDNPRYLVSSGDTPSILQEGSRYNALHVAAKSKCVEIVRVILESITNIEFIGYLYDDNDVNSCKERIEILLDMYLNMPDKGLNETPLHIAVKHGSVDIVEYLISYPQCQRNLVNKFHQQPKDIICSRVSNASETVKETISKLLEEQYYIPVLRYEDNTIQPRVGEAFSPSKPLNISEDLLSPRIEVRAYAGPMSKENAELFKKKWKSPPKSVKNACQSSTLRLQDMEKGLERIGRNLAVELNVPWKEYWPFLDTFADLSHEEGLQMFEQYMRKRFEETLEMVNSRSSSGNVELDEKLVSPMSALCEAMKLCSLNDDSVTLSKRLKWSSWNPDKTDSHRKIDENIDNDVKNPLLYVERSCEVFGKRVASAITSSSGLYGMHAECIKDSLEIQMKHLLSNILSYREDNRFQCVNFQMIHSRVAAVAVHSLEDFTDYDRSFILSSLKSIDWSDGTLSDDEDLSCSYRNLNQEVIGNSIKQHLHCLVKNLISELNDFNNKFNTITTTARNEADCSRMWALATPCCCSWSMNTYLRPRVGAKRKSSKYLRSNFDCDIRSSYRIVLPEEVTAENESRNISCKTYEGDEENEDVFCTPPSGLSDSEEETMEDPLDLPDTFIYDCETPTKMDYVVLDALESVHLSPEKYPNICRWKHLLKLHMKSSDQNDSSRGHLLNSVRKKNVQALNSPNSSPLETLNKSFGSCDKPRLRGDVEQWERILGPYSPRTPKKRTSLYSSFHNSESPIKR